MTFDRNSIIELLYIGTLRQVVLYGKELNRVGFILPVRYGKALMNIFLETN